MGEVITKPASKVQGFCPLTEMPKKTCYITDGERYTFSVIYYCLSSYEECEIFQTRMKGNNKEK